MCGSLFLLTLYSFHFADEDVATTLANFLDPESPTVQVAIPSLLKYYDTQYKSAKIVCNLLAITISYHTRGYLVGNAYYVNISGPLLLLHFDKDFL